MQAPMRRRVKGAETRPAGRTPSEVGAPGGAEIVIVTRGEIADEAIEYAKRRIGTLMRKVKEPILFARVKLTLAPDPARPRSAIVQSLLDIDGDLVRAHVAAESMPLAIDLLQRRLRDKLEHRARHRKALRKRPNGSEAGEWRHGDLPTARPDYYDRPVAERQLVRHKTFVIDELTSDEAIFDMEQLDYDFYLFGDIRSGEDAIVEREPGGSYRLTRLRPVAIDPGPTAEALVLSESSAPELGVEEAIKRLEGFGEPFLFFADATTHRGNVVYHRYDGHYGLITPE